jgi:hypothetical protein
LCYCLSISINHLLSMLFAILRPQTLDSFYKHRNEVPIFLISFIALISAQDTGETASADNLISIISSIVALGSSQISGIVSQQSSIQASFSSAGSSFSSNLITATGSVARSLSNLASEVSSSASTATADASGRISSISSQVSGNSAAAASSTAAAAVMKAPAMGGLLGAGLAVLGML